MANAPLTQPRTRTRRLLSLGGHPDQLVKSAQKTLITGAVRTAVEGAIRAAPHMSEKAFIGMFSGMLKNAEKAEAREFITEILIEMKRLLSSPEYKQSTATLMRRIVRHHAASLKKREAFIKQYGVRPLSFLVISPSMRCNLRCYGCYAGEYTKADDLSWETLNRVVGEARDMGVVFIVVSGGEPFFSENVMRMWEENPDISFLVYTNGTLIDEAMAKRLAKLGNVYPAISVEGFGAETDARRGKGTHDRILAAMENLRREGVLFGFSATVVQANNDLVSSPEFVDYYADKGAFLGWYFNYIPIGRQPDLSLMPTPEQRVARWQRLRELRKTKPILLADFWCDGALAGGCIAGGRSYLHINSNGDAEPCVFAHFAADNVKDKTLAEVMLSPLFNGIRARQPYSPNLLRPCMIIDNPDVLRSVVAEGGAHPTHAGAETILAPGLSGHLDDYARRYAGLADPVWAKEHPEKKG